MFLRYGRRYLIPFLAAFSLFFSCHDSFADRQNKVLLIHSYHAEYPWVVSITEGVQKFFEGKKVDLEIFYMDTKRQTSGEWKVSMGKKARQKIDTWKPDVVITADDNAQIFVTQKYANQKGLNFVFCGLNAEPEEYNLIAENITGIIERPHFKASIDFLRQIVKGVHRIAMISDLSPTSKGALDYMRRDKPDIKILGFHLLKDFEKWKKRIKRYQIDADAICIYMYHTLEESESGLSMSPQKVMEWTKNNLSIPMVGFFDFSIEDGMLCGVVESGEEHGREAAQMAWDILNGVEAGKIPIKRAAVGLKMINLQTAEKLGVSIPSEILQTTDVIVE